MLKLLAAIALLGLLLSPLAALGHGSAPPPPVSSPAPAPAPQPAPAASSSGTSAAFTFAKVTIAAVALYIAWCIATENAEWCQREDDPHAWPE